MDLTMWAANMGLEAPFHERLLAAAATGARQTSFFLRDAARTAAAGWTLPQLRAEAEQLGVGLIVDPVATWSPAAQPAEPGWCVDTAAFTVDDALDIATALGARSLTAVGWPTNALSERERGERFGELCDRAAAAGLRVQLEFMPHTSIPDLRTGWEIVRVAGRPNGGLLFDTWHFYRSDPDFELLARIPGDRIFEVQICDGVHGPDGADPRVRLLPGDGEFDLARALDALASIDALTSVGPEVFSTELAALGPLEAARIAAEGIRQLLANAPGRSRR